MDSRWFEGFLNGELQELGGLKFRGRVVPMVLPPSEELEAKVVRE